MVVTNHENGRTSIPPMKVTPRRKVGSWVGAIVVVILLIGLLRSLINNENLEWKVVGQYLFDGTVLTGVLYTVALTIITMAIGIVLGTILAIMRRSSNMLLSSIAQAYVWIFRTIPPLVQLLIWYN